MKVFILDDWFDTLRGLPCFDKLEGHDVTVCTDHEPDPTSLAERMKGAECLVLFRERTRIGAALLQELPDLKLISQRSVYPHIDVEDAALLQELPDLKLISQRSVYPHIDVEACTRNNVLLCSNMHSGTPSYAAAELTLALILASYRQIPEQTDSLKSGTWQSGVGRTLRGRTIGLYGYGRIAAVVADYAKVIGMEVQWWSSEQGRARAVADGETVAATREAFFATSDIVSIHVRLKPATRGIITAADLRAMQARSLFVNTSRSGLVETGALEAEIEKSRIYAAVDVFDEEPLTDTGHPLVTSRNVLATPHIGYVTEDEFDLQFSDIFDQINAYASGNPIHMINPEVWNP